MSEKSSAIAYHWHPGARHVCELVSGDMVSRSVPHRAGGDGDGDGDEDEDRGRAHSMLRGAGSWKQDEEAGQGSRKRKQEEEAGRGRGKLEGEARAYLTTITTAGEGPITCAEKQCQTILQRLTVPY